MALLFLILGYIRYAFSFFKIAKLNDNIKNVSLLVMQDSDTDRGCQSAQRALLI